MEQRQPAHSQRARHQQPGQVKVLCVESGKTLVLLFWCYPTCGILSMTVGLQACMQPLLVRVAAPQAPQRRVGCQ